MAKIGVDEWVAQSGDRRDMGTGWRGLLSQVDARVGWWQRLALAAAAGVVFGLITGNVNLLTVGFTCMLYAILSLGLNIAAGWSGLLDLGYIAFVGFGAYGYALFSSNALGSGGMGGAHLAGFFSLPIVMIAGGLVGVVIGLVALRLEGDYLAIVTLFVGQAFVEVVNNVDPGTLGGVNGIFGLDSLHGLSGNVSTPRGYYWVALIVIVGLAAVLRLLDTSRTGRAWRALRDDQLAADAMTIPVNKLKVMAFSFSAAIGALGGALFASQQTSVFPTNFTENILILIYACLVLGGAGSIAGAIAGGIIVWALEQMLSSPVDAGYLFYGLILLTLCLKIRPWRNLALVLAGIVVFGLVANALVGAISSSATAGARGQLRLDRLGRQRLGDRPLGRDRLRQRPLHPRHLPRPRADARAGLGASGAHRPDRVPGGVRLGEPADRQPVNHHPDHARGYPDRHHGGAPERAPGRAAR